VVQQGGGQKHSSAAVHGQVIQRELTDEAKKVLEAAKKNDSSFTVLMGFLDVIDILKNDKNVRAKHLDRIMELPPGASPALESFVQACLLKYFVARVLARHDLDDKKAIESAMADVATTKGSLKAAGYPQVGAITPELHSMLIASFGSLDLGTHRVQYTANADMRKLEVCATFVPGRKADYFMRAHSFIVYTDARGRMKFISAHDDGHGILRTETGDWSPTVFSDPGMERKVVATGDQAENAFPTMERAAARINSENLNYKMINQNCNSAAQYILGRAGFRGTSAPSGMTGTFGWSNVLEKQLDRPQRARGTAVQSLVRPTTQAPVTTAAPAPTGMSSTASTSDPAIVPVIPAPAASSATGGSTTTMSTSTASPATGPAVATAGVLVTVTFPFTIGTTLVLADTKVAVLGDPTTDMVEVMSLANGVRGFVDAEELRDCTTWYG
jgi:hypothetical protein